MAVRTLIQRTSLSNVGEELSYTASRLLAHEEGAPYAPTFVALRTKCIGLQAQEHTLRNAVVDAQAVVDHVDDLFDLFVKKHIRVIDAITNEDRNHALYRHFYGTKTPSEFSRPVLGTQLKAMAAWLPSLQTSEYADLKALAPELQSLLDKGKVAAQARVDAELARAQFRDVGDRYKFIEETNAERKDKHGTLSTLPHSKVHLPSNFADRFFRKETRSKDDDENAILTIKDADEAIKELEDQIAVVKAKRAELVADAAKAKQAKIKEREDALEKLAGQKAGLSDQEAAIRKEIEDLEKE